MSGSPGVQHARPKPVRLQKVFFVGWVVSWSLHQALKAKIDLNVKLSQVTLNGLKEKVCSLKYLHCKSDVTACAWSRVKECQGL